MKILLFHNTGLNEGQTRDEFHIADAFKQLGVNVFHNDESKLGEVDLILCFKGNNTSVESIRRWKSESKAPVWMWTFDNMDRCSIWYPTIKECDLWLGEELGRRERFIAQGLPFYYFPNHAVPTNIFTKIKSEKEYDLVFTGTPYSCEYNPDKNELLKAIDERFNLHVFGNRWWGWEELGLKNVHKPAFDHELSKVYGKANIVLALSNCQCEGYWSIRTSQALSCGAFTLARFTPQMEKELKDNVVYYQTINDCLEKIEYYLKHWNERIEIAKRGHEYAKKYLSIKQRLKELLILYENRNNILAHK